MTSGPRRSAWLHLPALTIAVLIAAMPVAAASVTLADILIVNQARSAAANGDPARAITILEREIARSDARPLDERIALLEDVAGYYDDADRHAEAGNAYLRLEQAVIALDGPTAPRLVTIREKAGTAYRRAGDYDSAIASYERALEIDRRYVDCGSEILTGALRRLAALYRQAGRPGDADRLRPITDDIEKRCADDKYRPASRRIAVGEKAEPGPDSYSRLSVYYATDRGRSGDPRPISYYGSERGRLEFGVLDVTVPRSHKPGMVEAPSFVFLQWTQNPDRHIVINRLETLSETEIVARMRASLAESRSDEAFVFVHGYNVTFADAARRTAQIAYDLNFEGIPFVYSWPSLGQPFGYISDEAVVRLGGRRLLAVLEMLTRRSGIERIHLIAHSMGARALADALELLAAQSPDRVEPLFDQILFAAPDADVDLFADMTSRMTPLARRMTLYASGRDAALATSRSLHGEWSRAGEAGAHVLVTDALDTIDMTDIGDEMLGHGYFASDTSALSDILWLFWRNDEPRKRCGMLPAAAPARGYWRYDPASCNGDVALSALTLLRRHGADALDLALAHLGETPVEPAAPKTEWRAIADLIRAALGQ